MTQELHPSRERSRFPGTEIGVGLAAVTFENLPKVDANLD